MTLSLCIAAACGGDDGGALDAAASIDATPPPDTVPTPDAAAPPDAAPPPDAATTNTVTATMMVTFIADSGETVVGVDLSGATIEALVPNAGSFDTYAGTGLAGGTLSIPGVPIGARYYLRINNLYFVTSAASLDLGYAAAGRPSPTVATTSPSNLIFNVTGLDSWQSTDDLQIMSSNVGEIYFDAADDATNAPTVGATALANMTVDWVDRNLVQGVTGGDRLTIAQLVEVNTAGEVFHRRLTKFFQASVFEQVGGVGSTLSGSFTDVVLDQSASFDWRRSQFAALISDVNPRATDVFDFITVAALPAADTHGSYSGAPDLLQLVPSSDGIDVATDALSFGNPYPAGWQQIGQVAHYSGVQYSVGTATPSSLYALFVVEDMLADFVSGSVRPLVSPVENLAVNGSSAFSELTGITTTPTLSWTAPSVGAANGYVVSVFRLADVGGATRFRRDALLRTTDTSIQIPPGVLDALGAYVFVVRARADPAGSFETAPLRTHLPVGVADTFTEKMQP